jgi:deazaflavin-dependent oxidoreductase (nitroreductase family)
MTLVCRKRGRVCNLVVYIKEGQDYLVSASTAGMDWHPGWYFNLRNKPEAKIEIGNHTYNVKATITDGEERTRLYEKFKAASSNFVKDEKGTSRVISVIRLTPADNRR